MKPRRLKTLILVVSGVPCLALCVHLELLGGRHASAQRDLLAALKEIVEAQQEFGQRDRDGDGLREYAQSLHELREAGLIDDELANGVLRGYLINVPSHSAQLIVCAHPLERADVESYHCARWDGRVIESNRV